MQELIILRAIPGCGRENFLRDFKNTHNVIATDDFFMNKGGSYIFDKNKLHEAHSWNQGRAEAIMKFSNMNLIINNTNIKPFEWEPYVVMARQWQYKFKIISIVARNYETRELIRDPKFFSERTIHNVPEETLFRMINNFFVHDAEEIGEIAYVDHLILPVEIPPVVTTNAIRRFFIYSDGSGVEMKPRKKGELHQVGPNYCGKLKVNYGDYTIDFTTGSHSAGLKLIHFYENIFAHLDLKGFNLEKYVVRINKVKQDVTPTLLMGAIRTVDVNVTGGRSDDK